MTFQLKWSRILVAVSLMLVVALMGSYSAHANITNAFQANVTTMKLLKVLPEKDWDPAKTVTHREIVEFGEKWVNGRVQEPLFSNLVARLNTPDAVVTYQEAIMLLGQFLGYQPEAAPAVVKELTPKLIRADADQITGYDMAYLFASLLYANRAGQGQTLLEERYVVGSEPIRVSRVLQITADKIDLETEGVMKLAADLQAFSISGDRYVPMNFSSVAVGMGDLRFRLNAAGEVQTVILTKRVHPERIRVLISQDLSSIGGSNSYDFPEVKIQAERLFKVISRKDGDEVINFIVEPKEAVTMKNVDGKIQVTVGKLTHIVEDRVFIKTFYPYEPLQVMSTKRIGKNPTFEGYLEVTPSAKEGHLYLVNDLLIEQYLKKVVPSEIPTTWGKEAFKVQAVAARSYAIAQISGGRYEAQSANVDDSIMSQVYNNCVEHPLVNEAIKETAGLVPMYKGEVIDAVFSSTISGYTASRHEVWNDTPSNTFPGSQIPYLMAKSLIIGDTVVRDMTDEATALAFFKDWTFKCADTNSPFYRWRLELTREELEKTINKNLPGRENADVITAADFIQTVTGTPVNPNDPNFSIGTLKDLKVVQRGQGGNMMVLDVVGTNGTYRIIKEYNIRFVIRPVNTMTGTRGDVVIKRYDGSNLRNYSILPSAFAAFEIERDAQGEIVKVVFHGGGNGHGVGMSQWGMKGMVDMGHKFDYILKQYYTGIELVKIY